MFPGTLPSCILPHLRYEVYFSSTPVDEKALSKKRERSVRQADLEGTYHANSNDDSVVKKKQLPLQPALSDQYKMSGKLGSARC